jgi:hypothetical protein
MAKKSRVFRLIDSYVQAGYRNGCWQSLIIHTLGLLILSFIVDIDRYVEVEPIVITMSQIDEEPLNMDSYDIDIVLNDALPSEESRQKMLGIPEQIAVDIDVQQPLSNIDRSVVKNDLAALDPKELMSEVVEDSETIEPTEVVQNTQPVTRSIAASNNRSNVTLFKEMLAGGTHLADNIPPGDLVNRPGGSSGGIESRLKMYGAKTGDIQISVSWDTVDDIDLHVTYMNNSMINDRIHWQNRFGRSGGILDIDMNANGPVSNTPIENIFWPYQSAPTGQYIVQVHFFRAWSNRKSVPVLVRIKTTKGILMHTVVVGLNQPPITVATFSN